MGVPIVCSELAAKGVDAIPGEHVLTASTAAEYVDAIMRLLENREERRRFSEAGRARVLSNHNWVNSMKKLDLIIEECVDRFRTRQK
jgi:glycosyltransferase involved in cell wall biosynthesis